MQDTDETRALVKQFSDRSRKTSRKGKQFIVPHKFTPQGDVLTNDNFNPKRDLSRLSLDDFRLLAALQKKGWDLKAACEDCQIDVEVAQRKLKKLSYFEFEDKKAKALAAVATPAFVTAQNVEGFYQDHLTDGQRDHLKELAKITGAYKNTATQVNIQQNFLQVPQFTPEQEQELRKVFDTIATQPEQLA